MKFSLLFPLFSFHRIFFSAINEKSILKFSPPFPDSGSSDLILFLFFSRGRSKIRIKLIGIHKYWVNNNNNNKKIFCIRKEKDDVVLQGKSVHDMQIERTKVRSSTCTSFIFTSNIVLLVVLLIKYFCSGSITDTSI